MRDIDWKILTTLYKNQNITKTANAFFISQPTLTKRLQQIEHELGAQLIVRNNKGISFTTKGELVVKCAERIQQLTDELQGKLSESGQWDIGTLKIGISGSIANYVIPGFFTGFTSRHPKLKAEITDYISGDTVDLITKKKLDIGFICSEVYSSYIAKHLLRKEPCYLVSKKPIKLSELPGIPRTYINQNEYSKNIVQNWWDERYSIPPEFGFKAHSGNIAVQMIENGLCYGLIFFRGQRYFEERNLYSEALYFLDRTPVYRNCWLIYHRDREHDPLIQNFLKEIKECDFSNF